MNDAAIIINLIWMAAVIAAICGAVAAIVSSIALSRIRRVEHATNGMKKQLEDAAYARGVKAQTDDPTPSPKHDEAGPRR